jgi:hypothetical protein
MKITTKLFLLTFVLMTLLPITATGATILQDISITDELERTQIVLQFSTLPKCSTNIVSRRINLICTDTFAIENIPLPLAGERIIKTLKTQQEKQMELSFFLRYTPQNVTTEKKESDSILILDILPGNPYSQKYPDLSDQLLGATIMNRDKIDYTNPLQTSFYAGNWLNFFKQYESQVYIEPTVKLTLPDFPLISQFEIIIQDEQWLPKSVTEAASYKKWNIVETILTDTIENEKNEDLRLRLLLTYCETLIRKGDYDIPADILEKFKRLYPDNKLINLADFLSIYQLIQFKDPYLGFIDLKKYDETVQINNTVAPYLNILLAESALLTGNYDEADIFLKRDNVAYINTAKNIRNIRQADLLYLKNNKIGAMVSYMDIVKQNDILYNMPRSLAFYADTLYNHKRYQDAEQNYVKLGELITDKRHQDLTLFRLTMSRLKQKQDVYTLLSQIQYSYPGSEGAFRARLKINDLYYIDRKIPTAQIIKDYEALTQEANKKNLREEATFKLAIVQALENNNIPSVNILMKQLRDFRNGDLFLEAKALLVERLPLAIHEQIEKQNFVEALVLAKKNREFFKKGWIDNSILYDLAVAYEQIGANMRSATAYKYILESTPKKFQEAAYLPLLKILYNNGQFDQVEKYANQYFSFYNKGKDSNDIFLIRMKALNESGKTSYAANLLKNNKQPNSTELDEVAAHIFFNLAQYTDVIQLLDTEKFQSQLPENSKLLFFLAESYFQNEKYNKAKQLFIQLKTYPSYRDQAIFREGQILLENNEKRTALMRFNKLTEKGTSPLWKKLAEEQIQMINMHLTKGL